VRKAEKMITSILYADDEERNRIRQEQLKVAEELNTALYPYAVDESMMTPYGPASPSVKTQSLNIRLTLCRFRTTASDLSLGKEERPLGICSCKVVQRFKLQKKK
jgi:hypothetical protein